MDDVKRIRSTIDDGLAGRMKLEFNYATDPDKKYQDVIRELNAVRPELPADILSIDIQRFRPSDVNILQVALLSETAPYRDVSSGLEQKIKADRLEKIKTCSRMSITGPLPRQQVRVSLNLEKLSQNKIPLNHGPAGHPGGERSISPREALTWARENSISRPAVNSRASTRDKEYDRHRLGGKDHLYKRYCRCRVLNYDEQTIYIGRLNGKRGVFVTASRKSGTNIFAVEKEMDPVLDKFKAELPPGITYEKSFNNAQSVRTRLGHFTRDFGLADFC